MRKSLQPEDIFFLATCNAYSTFTSLNQPDYNIYELSLGVTLQNNLIWSNNNTKMYFSICAYYDTSE